MSTAVEVVRGEMDRPEERRSEYEGPICAVCHEPIEVCDYSNQTVKSTHKINLTVFAMAGDASLPHVLEIHGDCLKDLKDELIKINRGYKWI